MVITNLLENKILKFARFYWLYYFLQLNLFPSCIADFVEDFDKYYSLPIAYRLPYIYTYNRFQCFTICFTSMRPPSAAS